MYMRVLYVCTQEGAHGRQTQAHIDISRHIHECACKRTHTVSTHNSLVDKKKAEYMNQSANSMVIAVQSLDILQSV